MFKRFILCVATVLMIINLISVSAEDVKYEFKYGKEGKIEAILIEDFASGEINSEHTWRDGKVEMKEGKIILTGTSLADTYGVGIPKANQDKKYREAKYLGLNIVNKSDGDVYYCFQARNTEEVNIFMSPEAKDPYYLIDETGRKLDVVFSSEASAYSRYGIMIPKDFKGYLLVPTNGIVFLNEWDTPIWGSNIDIKYLGVHASASLDADPFADATDIIVEVDDLFMLKGDLPAYTDLDPTPSPTPSPTPEKTEEPTASPKPTDKVDNTEKPGSSTKEKDDNGINPLYIAVPAAVVIIAAIVIVVIKKKK